MISTYHRVYLSIHMLFTWFAFNFGSASKALAVHESGCACVSVCVCWCPSHFGASSFNRFFFPVRMPNRWDAIRCDAMWCYENVRFRICLHIKKHICASESFASFLQSYLNFFPCPPFDRMTNVAACFAYFFSIHSSCFGLPLIASQNEMMDVK